MFFYEFLDFGYSNDLESQTLLYSFMVQHRDITGESKDFFVETSSEFRRFALTIQLSFNHCENLSRKI